MNVNRNELLAQGIIMRNSLCDFCGQRAALQMHELFPRSLTRGNEMLWQLSYQPEVVSFLCEPCHHNAPCFAEDVWRQNFRRYGQQRVIERVNQILEQRPTLRAAIPMEVLDEFFT